MWNAFVIAGPAWTMSGFDLGQVNYSSEDKEICLALELFSTGAAAGK